MPEICYIMKSATMCMRMFITPDWNVRERSVEDKSLIFFVEYHWEDTVFYRFKGSDRVEEILVKNISVYDHYLVVSGNDFRILSANSERDMEEYGGDVLPLSDHIKESMSVGARRVQSVMDSSV